MAQPILSADRIKTHAKESIRKGGDIREKMRDLTLRALKHRPLDPGQIKAVVRAMTEGIVAGAAKPAGELSQILSQAFTGLDQALMKSAEAAHLAIQELASKGEQFNDKTLQQALANLKRLEEDFLSTVTEVADKAEGKVKAGLQDLVKHARRTGTDTGARAAETANALSASMDSLIVDSAKLGLHAAREAGERLAALASGILVGMADALKDEPQLPKSQAKKGTPKGTKHK